MRKCDICQTPIPLGQDHCPNCGYRMPKERGTSQSQREVKKKIYMAQFQPHPNPVDHIKKQSQIRWHNNRTVPKGTRKALIAIILSFFLVPLITSLVTELVHFVSDFTMEDNTVEAIEFPAFESYDNLVELEKAHPEIAQEVGEVQQKVKEKLRNQGVYEDVYYMYEDYQTEDGQLDYAYFSFSWPQDINDVSVIYSCYDGDWEEEIEYYCYAGDDSSLTLSKKSVDFIANYMEVSSNGLYDVCSELIANNMDYEYIEADSDIYDYATYENVDIMLTMYVDPDQQISYYILSATKEFE